MGELDAFLDVFGHITIAQLVLVASAILFGWAIYKKISDYLMKKHDAAQEKDAQLKKALETVEKYPEYRQQSIKIQEHLENEIQELRTAMIEVVERLTKVEEQNKKKECNKLRDILIERHRYYTDKERNPSQSWTVMESEAFWSLFRDYEDLGGNDYVHSHVQPDMERLKVIDMQGAIQN